MTTTATPTNNRWVGGLLAGLAAALVGSGWQLATRQATTTQLPPQDLLILRYGVPALLLSPLLMAEGWRHALRPRGLRWSMLLAVVVGGGLPFGLTAMSGTRFAPAAHMGVLLAAASPVLAALLAWVLWRERPTGPRAVGLAMMAGGVMLLGGRSLWLGAGAAATVWLGDALFLGAAALWAVYTLGFRAVQRTLGTDAWTPWRATALVNAWSAIGVTLGWALALGLGAGPPLQAPAADLAWQALWQGVLAGVLGLWTFNAAIARLGAAQAAAFGALVPALSAVGGWVVLDERLDAAGWLAVALSVLGVALASGAIRYPSRSRPVVKGNAT